MDLAGTAFTRLRVDDRWRGVLASHRFGVNAGDPSRQLPLKDAERQGSMISRRLLTQ
jgi:hypothetical protein